MCGRGKVWLDPNEGNEIFMDNSHQNMRKLVKDGFIISKPTKIHSRSHARRMKEANSKGHHSGYDNNKGTREARLPTKGNVIKNKCVLTKISIRQKLRRLERKSCPSNLILRGQRTRLEGKEILLSGRNVWLRELEQPAAPTSVAASSQLAQGSKKSNK
ncbi:60S ribosomal protein L19-1 [Capsicum baccatum]|uniref:60S ribosomal protein L19-1 n=1 Tax=Capsicum baccatum TaxID=33114 RepID=A0A2G2V6J5_CAPBA|nr:60S ribosomal protein L19-1 [Capsicum baccatum]